MDCMLDVLTVHLESVDGRTLDILANVLIGQAILTFLNSLFTTNRSYGKFLPVGNATVNASLAWFVFELPCFVFPVLLLFTKGPRVRLAPNVFFTSLFIFHYINRSLVYPFLIKSKPFPVRLLVFSVIFTTINTFLQCVYLLYRANFAADWATTPRVWTGVALFLFGLSVNIYSDHLLLKLRKPGETTYKIPRGGLFEYVSGANFFGEIVEWAGFAIATWSYPAFAFAFCTAACLGMRGYHNHRYYQHKFENYPKSRKAIIPFIL